MWTLLPSIALLLGHLACPAWAECPPSQKGNDTNPCDCVTATRIFRDCLHCPPELGCQCSFSEELLNVTQFYAMNCQGLPAKAVYVAVVVPIMGLFLIAALTYFLVRSKKGEPLAHDKWTPDTAEGQPRPRRLSDFHGEQPVYANTQGMYYNYAGKGGQGEESVYITPDE
ncbi:uncharacterized protein LOC121916634 isoform X2 [Sceloporus undulatus]|uniref:uncharacterized protein LOC121916634 isoform X2 n=1 Tax=Sceloporus undulatus TaxID=8520 RepID=UPI001C4C3C49|nr:uncharacterized protein LOC121916634 isoform X2 [Sceloporus undulatus]